MGFLVDEQQSRTGREEDPEYGHGSLGPGQVVNMIRPRTCMVTEHISIPASYSSGITLAINREAPAYQELRTTPELPLWRVVLVKVALFPCISRMKEMNSGFTFLLGGDELRLYLPSRRRRTTALPSVREELKHSFIFLLEGDTLFSLNKGENVTKRSCVPHSFLMSFHRMKPRSGDWAVMIDFLQETAITSLYSDSSVNC
ncbi:unnamed protein product, partial [Timema podura]|nr:unnamed protein product [Timema podura]